jgi:PAS domain S-box-containing protein
MKMMVRNTIQESRYARSLIEASLDPLFTVNTEGKIMDVNQASLNITGQLREQLVGSDFFHYFTKPDSAKQAYLAVFDKGFVSDYPLTIRDHKLTDVLLNGSIFKDDDGNVLGVVVVARDITELKRFENELKDAKIFAEHATEFAETAQGDAVKASQQANDAVKAKQQFLSNMSHEIRTPMNAIIGFTKVLLKTDLSTKQFEYLSAIKMSGDALIVLINDILDLAKVDSGKMTFEECPFKLKTSIAAMLHLFESKIHEKNIELIIEYDIKIPPVVVGDSVRLNQIILNLVSNAVKFTNAGTITMSVQLLKENEQTVTLKFAVSDTGIGISKNKINQIFENFQQAYSSTSLLFGGTGLGLAIVKQLVELQGGSVAVESELSQGSTFSFILDFKKTTANALQQCEEFEINQEIKDIHILVVEDIPLNQLLMKTLLDDFGFKRDIASNGKIAIEKMKIKNYDVILMDLQMPEMNGFEATEYIRNQLKSTIPIIALTADVTTADVNKCKAVGMDDYISKPVNEKLLYNKIISVLKNHAEVAQLTLSSNKQTGSLRYTDLSYLMKRTKSNPTLMMEMISLYLEQTPPLILSMKKSLQDKDWNSLHASVHKIIPSFSIMGMNADFENIAKQVQEYATSQEAFETIGDLVMKLESACTNACNELKIEFETIKNSLYE